MTYAPASVPDRVPRARRDRAGRAGQGDDLRLRPAAAREGARGATRRRSRASGSCSATRIRSSCRCSTSPTCAHCSRSSTRMRARPSSRASAASRRRPSVCCSARSCSLEDGGGTEFFGEPQFAVADLLRIAPDGRGIVSCLELPAVQDKPKLFSTALMWMIADLFETLPEVGDLPKPKLVFFFDEAHLLFDGASKAFLQSIEQTVRLVRSKGVGRLLRDADAEGRAGGRARTARQSYSTRVARLHARRREGAQGDREHVPEVAVLRPRQRAHPARDRRGGRDDPLRIRRADAGRRHEAPRPATRRMAPADNVDAAAKASPLFAKYGTAVDSQSAREILASRLQQQQLQPDGSAGGAGEATARGGGRRGCGRRGRDRRVPQVAARPAASAGSPVRGVFGLLKKQL